MRTSQCDSDEPRTMAPHNSSDPLGAGSAINPRIPNPGIELLSFRSLLELGAEKMAEILATPTFFRQLSQFAAAVFFFHASEYALAIAFHGRPRVTLSCSCRAALLISKHYVIAMTFALLEYILETFYFPTLKEYWWISNLGLLMVLVGEVIRKAAVITGGRSFTHMIRKHYEEEHVLVTQGIYSYIRHPGYCGFFIWATGTQVMLCNPISIIAFTVVVWRFFSTRIPYEEFFLRQMFGSQYVEYAQRVPSGLPLIK